MDIIRQENVIKNNAKRNMKIIKDNNGNGMKINLRRFLRKRDKRQRQNHHA